MAKEAIGTGKSVEAAIEAACQTLGYAREECQFEIISMPSRGFLGLKTNPAKVRVWLDEPEPVIKAQQKPKTERPVPVARPSILSGPASSSKAYKQDEQKREGNALTTTKTQPIKAAAPNTIPASEKEKPAFPAVPRPERPRPVRERGHRESISVYSAQKAALAEEYLKAMLAALQVESTLEIREEEGGLGIDIVGSSLGVIIGKRGDTLDAIQYLTSLVANRIDNNYMRVTVDCGNYRIKRKETLVALAGKLASQVLKTNVSRTLEPMNPFERRVIHATVSEIEGVSSFSTGDEPNRRVVITSPSARSGGYSRDSRGMGRDTQGSRSGGRGFSDDSRGGRSRERDRGSHDSYRDKGDKANRSDRRGSRQPSPSITKAPDNPKETPESSAGQGKLYGKIDLE